jgi:predicted esterase
MRRSIPKRDERNNGAIVSLVVLVYSGRFKSPLIAHGFLLLNSTFRDKRFQRLKHGRNINQGGTPNVLKIYFLRTHGKEHCVVQPMKPRDLSVYFLEIYRIMVASFPNPQQLPF